ncbi:IS66 family insertion sequence element accessory protein TnpB [Sinorhizobium medicae]|nr:IS66 family insertion sequence element accessory protein TnpB [Sinorhizobium medicae]MBO1965461.1 IS66 family insertion sequence element accessory protein TnpB [Sinorhizobium medicae]WQO57044.1 IS66 family insertion sequence element accessory protein TnpB [Sinorhizobium medicae]WQP41049.1 IS66 family insertion sequence element accessory protein TnpB [Sinorhizobium medicae]
MFRSKRADRVRIVWWDGSGVCLYSKTLEEQSFAGRAYRPPGYVWTIRN